MGHREDKTRALPAPAQFLWQYLPSTPLAGPVAEASDDARTALEKAVGEKWERFVTGAGMTFVVGLTTVTGRN